MLACEETRRAKEHPMKKSLGAATISLTCPTWIVGTYDANDKPNVMAAAWGGICCSQPPCIYVSLREATYSHGNIVKRQAFTVSVPSVEQARQADYFGMVSGRDVDKFAASGLTPVRSDLVDAPYVGEFPLVLECKLLHTIEIGLHTQFIGEIADVKADEAVLNDKGGLDIRRAKPFIFNAADGTYYAIGDAVGKGFSIGEGVG